MRHRFDCCLELLLFFVIIVHAKNITNVPKNMYVDWINIGLTIHNVTSCLPEQILCNVSVPERPEAPRHCRCDKDCWIYGDCCIDAAEKAWNDGKIVQEQQWGCEKLPVKPSNDDIYLYMVTQCPANFTDSYTASMCHRNVSDMSKYWYVMDIPVMSKSTGKIYTNVFCAVCNNDLKISDTTLSFHCNVDKCLKLISKSVYVPKMRIWDTQITDSEGNNKTEHIYFSVPFFENFTLTGEYEYRLCNNSVDDCAHVTPSDPDRKKCKLFSGFVQNSNSIPFKNYFCSKCNRQSEQFHQDLQCITNASPYVPQSGKKVLSFSAPSYSLLLDFSKLTSGSDNSHHHCKPGEVYDPLQKQCAMFYCSKGYVKKGNACVPIKIPDKDLNPSVKPDTNSSDSNDPTPRSIIENPHCRRVLHENFTLFPNESVLIDSFFDKIYAVGEYELVNDTAVLVCVPDEIFCPSKYSTIQKIVTIICLPLSLTCLAIHIVTTIAMKKFKNLPGKNILSLSIMLFLAQLLFVFVDSIRNRLACYVFAAVVHFCFLSTFFWVNVLAADLCRNLFNPQNWKDGTKHLKTYFCYAMYAWLFPILIVSLALIVDNTSFLPVLRPEYGIRLCWFSKANALVLFFVVPMAILLVENVIFFLVTAFGIYKSTKAANRLRAKTERMQLFLYIKLALIMGLTWVIGFVATFVNYEPLWVAFIVMNALQGTFIFISFTLKRDIIQKCKAFFTNKYRQWNSTISRDESSSSTTTLPSAISQTFTISSS